MPHTVLTARSTPSVWAGTTDARIAPSTPVANWLSARLVRSQMSNVSDRPTIDVSRRQTARHSAPSQTPTVVSELPRSIAKSMGEIHLTVDLRAKLGLHSAQDFGGGAVPKFVRIGLDHHPHHRLGAAWSDVDPSLPGQDRGRGLHGFLHPRVRIPILRIRHREIDEHLRPRRISLGPVAQAGPAHSKDAQQLDHRQQAIARGRVTREDDMAALLAPDQASGGCQLARHVLVTHLGSQKPDPAVREVFLEAAVAHDGSDDRLGLELPTLLVYSRPDSHHPVAVNQLAVRVGEDGPVGIA